MEHTVKTGKKSYINRSHLKIIYYICLLIIGITLGYFLKPNEKIVTLNQHSDQVHHYKHALRNAKEAIVPAKQST